MTSAADSSRHKDDKSNLSFLALVGGIGGVIGWSLGDYLQGKDTHLEQLVVVFVVVWWWRTQACGGIP